MKKLTATMVMLVFGACAGSSGSSAKADPEAKRPGDSVAYFAGGCFWGVEHYMEAIDGVTGVDSGYMGGDVERPTYEQVSSKTSGHLETVRVRFDSKRVSYETIARTFFEIHDPTQENGQGPDIGPQYRSAVFYVSPAQKQTTEALIKELIALGYDVVTKVRPATQFWKAEAYHQDYYARTGKQPYCHIRVPRFETPNKE